MNEIWIINGIPGAGKSTTAKALCKHFEKAAHIEGDMLQDMIISGNVAPGQMPLEEEQRQIHLNVHNQCLLAKSFNQGGFIPVIDYVVVNNDRIDEYLHELKDYSVFLVTLNPGIDIALKRDKARPEKTVAHIWTHLDEIMKKEIQNRGFWIDTSSFTIEETIEEILKNKEAAKIQ